MAASLALAIEAALSTELALASLIAQVFGLLLLSQSTPLEISVDEQMLYVGKAKIERKYIESVQLLNADEMRCARGPEANVRAYLALRFWVQTGVKIVINDSNDPTPYWLVSTKRGKALQEALGR